MRYQNLIRRSQMLANARLVTMTEEEQAPAPVQEASTEQSVEEPTAGKVSATVTSPEADPVPDGQPNPNLPALGTPRKKN